MLLFFTPLPFFVFWRLTFLEVVLLTSSSWVAVVLGSLASCSVDSSVGGSWSATCWSTPPSSLLGWGVPGCSSTTGLSSVVSNRRIESSCWSCATPPFRLALCSFSFTNWLISEDQALDTEFTQLHHSTSSTLKFQLLKSFNNNLILCDVSHDTLDRTLQQNFRKQFSRVYTYWDTHRIELQSH